MTQSEFFREFVGLYRRARVPTFPAEGITRARCRSVAGGLEDLTAAYIARNMPDQCQIFVDQPVTLDGRDVRYPDLVLCENRRRVICSFLDVKTDLGWKRDEIKPICARLRELANAKAVPAVSFPADASRVQAIGPYYRHAAAPSGGSDRRRFTLAAVAVNIVTAILVVPNELIHGVPRERPPRSPIPVVMQGPEQRAGGIGPVAGGLEIIHDQAAGRRMQRHKARLAASCNRPR